MQPLKSKKQQLLEAFIPLEVLYWQIKWKPYSEMTSDFNKSLSESIDKLREHIMLLD